MKYFNKLLKAEKSHEVFLGIVFIIYILLNVDTPSPLVPFIDTTLGSIVVVVLALSVFASTNPIVGILGLIAAYELLRRSGNGLGFPANNYISSENNKIMDFSKFNDFPITLEEEVVAKMAPLVRNDASPYLNYKPVLDNTHDAASL